MSNNRATETDRETIRTMATTLRGAALGLKQYNSTGDGLLQRGIITTSSEPVTLFLKAALPADDYKTYLQYKTLNAMFDDGWVVDV